LLAGMVTGTPFSMAVSTLVRPKGWLSGSWA
jgi:hypothetical protein